MIKVVENSMFKILKFSCFVLVFAVTSVFAGKYVDSLHILEQKEKLLEMDAYSKLYALEGSSGKQISVMERKLKFLESQFDSNTVLLSFDERFLLNCFAVQVTKKENKTYYWENIKFLLSKKDSIDKVIQSKNMLGAEVFSEEQFLAENIDYEKLEQEVFGQNFAPETKDFFKLFLKRMLSKYDASFLHKLSQKEYDKNALDTTCLMEDRKLFVEKHPASKYDGVSLPEINPKKYSRHDLEGKKNLHYMLAFGFTPVFYSGDMEDQIGSSYGFNVLAEFQWLRFVTQLSWWNGLSDGEYAHKANQFNFLVGFTFIESRSFSFDALVGIGDTYYNLREDFDTENKFTAFVGGQADYIVPVSDEFDLVFRLQYLLSYITFDVKYVEDSGSAVQKVSLMLGFDFGKPSEN